MPATVCEGDIARREIEAFLGAVAVTGTRPCRKLPDGTISREARAARGWLAAQAS